MCPYLAGRWPLTPEADGSFFIDRDPKGFSLILKCLRSERIDERSVCAEKMAAFRQDVEYYGLPDELVNKSLGRMEEPEVFSSVDHSDGVVLSSTNTAATFCRDENCRMGWVLGTNSYGGHDRVLITLRIERGNDMTFGVMCGRPRIFQCFGYSSALSFSDCDESDGKYHHVPKAGSSAQRVIRSCIMSNRNISKALNSG